MAEWPFNPNFPEAFSFPAFGTAEWLALAWWRDYKGDANKVRDADKIRAGTKLNWQAIWFQVYQRNDSAAYGRRFLNRIHFADAHAARSVGVEGWQGTPTKTSVISLPDTEHYSLMRPGQWVETLLGADDFWWYDINAWALDCAEKEFRILNPHVTHLAAYGIGPDTDGTKTKRCEHLCSRFHAYQQARYRYHQHLLEKHCERALGEHAPGTPIGYVPKTAKEARASLIGWLSKQRGYAANQMVKEFRRAMRVKNSALSLKEENSFHAERKHPSKRKWRADADEVGWLILTWPIWNFHGWRFVDVSYALRRKFRVKDGEGQSLDFLAKNRKRMTREMRSQLDRNNSMPAEGALALFAKHLFKETAEERDWRRLERKRSDDKAIEQLCRGVVRLPVLPRPKGAPTKQTEAQNPPLWDFAYGISV